MIQPGRERVNDPNFQAQLQGYYKNANTAFRGATQRGGEFLADGMRGGSEFIRRDMGYNVGTLGADYVERVTGHGRDGYNRVGPNADNAFSVPSADAQEAGQADDFFGTHLTRGAGVGASNGFGSSGGFGSDSYAAGGIPTNAPTAKMSSYDGPTTTPSNIAPPPAADDGWAKLAPRSAAAAAASGGSSGRASPAGGVNSKAAPAKAKKKEDWDDWGEWQD